MAWELGGHGRRSLPLPAAPRRAPTERSAPEPRVGARVLRALSCAGPWRGPPSGERPVEQRQRLLDGDGHGKAPRRSGPGADAGTELTMSLLRWGWMGEGVGRTSRCVCGAVMGRNRDGERASTRRLEQIHERDPRPAGADRALHRRAPRRRATQPRRRRRLDLPAGAARPRAAPPGQGGPLYVVCPLTVLGQTHADVGEGRDPKAAFSDALKRAAARSGSAARSERSPAGSCAPPRPPGPLHAVPARRIGGRTHSPARLPPPARTAATPPRRRGRCGPGSPRARRAPRRGPGHDRARGRPARRPASLPVPQLSHSSVALVWRCPERWRRRFLE